MTTRRGQKHFSTADVHSLL